MRYLEIIGKSKIKETASGGATGASSVATVVGALGAGFDDDFSKSIYGEKKKPVIIKRIPDSDNK